YKLLFAALSFSFVMIGTIVHLVPILKDLGAAPMQAAGTAALVGIFSIIGRLGTGALLDRYRANIVGSCAYLLPIPGYVVLLADGGNPLSQMFAVAMFGLTLGAEVDVITYLITRHFGLKRFASVTSVMFSFIALGAALGPLAAGTSFDRFGGYAPYMLLTITMAAIASLAVLSMRRPPFAAAGHPH
ncbi:MAG: MFS transporter, partial [Sphingomonadales bacterium]